MISLIELAKEGKIEKTGAKPKLPINLEGINSTILDVYRIPLKYLYYNDNNGRISAGISKYESEITPQSDIINSNYNNLIQKIIESENKSSLSKTQKSIEDQGQQVYGWVLDDGRIIDGNRRFTALRNIYKKTQQTKYFEAVVLPFSYDNDSERVKIKQLELAIQMGIENPEDYDSVDLAVDIYRTTNGNSPIMTLEDYAIASHMKLSKAKEILHGAQYMKKFLEFLGASETSYDIIKDSQTWSLFQEMGKKLNRKFSNRPESQVQKNETMESYFGVILHQIQVGVKGSTARTHIRDYGKYIVSTSNNQKFNSEVQGIVEDLADSIKEAHIDNYINLTKQLSKENNLISEFGEKYNNFISSAKSGESVDKFISTIEKSVNFYNQLNERKGLIGNLHFNQFSQDQIRKLSENMRELTLVSKGLFDLYESKFKSS